MEILPFVTEKFWQNSTSINVFRVAGTKQLDYAGLTWLEFLEKGEKVGL